MTADEFADQFPGIWVSQKPEEVQYSSRLQLDLIHRSNIIQKYNDFDKNEYRYHTIASFNWEDHAFSVLNKYD